VDRVHGLWTVQEWLVHGSTMDRTVAGGQSTLELGLVAALRHDDLPRRHERQKGSAGSLAVASPWASGGGEQSSVVALGVQGAQGEESWGAWCGGVVAGAALYRLREQGRRGIVDGGVV
jgi:hypothetical protein